MSNGKGATKQDSPKKSIAGSTSDDGTAKVGSGTGSGGPPPPGNVHPKPKGKGK